MAASALKKYGPSHRDYGRLLLLLAGAAVSTVGRCMLDPSLKAPCFQPLNLECVSCFQTEPDFSSLRHYTTGWIKMYQRSRPELFLALTVGLRNRL